MNKITLTGRIANNLEIKNEVVRISLAVESYSNKEKKTIFVPCAVFGEQAKNILNLTEKGKRILVDRRLDITKKDDKTYTNVIINSFEIIDFKEKEKAENKSEDFLDSEFPF